MCKPPQKISHISLLLRCAHQDGFEGERSHAKRRYPLDRVLEIKCRGKNAKIGGDIERNLQETPGSQNAKAIMETVATLKSEASTPGRCCFVTPWVKAVAEKQQRFVGIEKAHHHLA